jgi:hypothetical protein
MVHFFLVLTIAQQKTPAGLLLPGFFFHFRHIPFLLLLLRHTALTSITTREQLGSRLGCRLTLSLAAPIRQPKG